MLSNKSELRPTSDKQRTDLLTDFAPKPVVVENQLPDISEVKDLSMVILVKGNIKILYMALQGAWIVVKVLAPTEVTVLPNINDLPPQTFLVLSSGGVRTLYISDDGSWKSLHTL